MIFYMRCVIYDIHLRGMCCGCYMIHEMICHSTSPIISRHIKHNI